MTDSHLASDLSVVGYPVKSAQSRTRPPLLPLINATYTDTTTTQQTNGNTNNAPTLGTPIKPATTQSRLNGGNSISHELKESPGPLRGFFDLISPELKRMRSTQANGNMQTIQPITTNTNNLHNTISPEDDDAATRALQCDETLAPIPIFFEHDDTNETNEINHAATTTATNMDIHTTNANSHHDGSGDLLSVPFQGPTSGRAPMKSPMSTLLSASAAVVKPNPAELPTPRGLSFTFGDLTSQVQLATYNNGTHSQTSNSVVAAATAPSAQPTSLPPPINTSHNVERSISRTSIGGGSLGALSPTSQLAMSSSPTSFASAGANSPRCFTCSVPDCGKSFPSNSALAMHLLVHSGDKPFACPQRGCTKRFRQKGHLVSHFRKHTGEKPFLCPGPGCSKRFKDKSGLNTHVKRQHPGVSAVHVTASADTDDLNMDPALEAAIAEANITLQALQSSTLAQSAQQARPTSANIAKKRTHSTTTSTSNTPMPDDRRTSLNGSVTPINANETTSANMDDPSFTALNGVPLDDEMKSDSDLPLPPQPLPHDDHSTKVDSDNLPVDGQDDAICHPLKKRRSDVGAQSSQTQLSQHHHPQQQQQHQHQQQQQQQHQQQPLYHSVPRVTSPALLSSRLYQPTSTLSLGGVGDSHPSHRPSSNYSPMTIPPSHGHAPSPIPFTSHIHGVRVTSIGSVNPHPSSLESRSGGTTPTNSFPPWMPNVPIPAPIVSHSFTQQLQANYSNASSPTMQSHAQSSQHIPPSSSSSSQSFNPSTTSAFSFKAPPTLAATAATL